MNFINIPLSTLKKYKKKTIHIILLYNILKLCKKRNCTDHTQKIAKYYQETVRLLEKNTIINKCYLAKTTLIHEI